MSQRIVTIFEDINGYSPIEYDRLIASVLKEGEVIKSVSSACVPHLSSTLPKGYTTPFDSAAYLMAVTLLIEKPDE